MAKLDVQGFDAFSADLEAAKNLTEDEQFKILEAGGEVVKTAMRSKLSELGLRATGRLAESIEIVRKVEETPYVLIEPKGKHHSYRGRDEQGRRGKGGRKTATAGEVGFVFEYGAASRHIPAYHWMEKAVEGSTEETTVAMQNAFNAVLDEKGVGQ